ncbi:MAG: signal transduction histidine kinase, partial [Bacteroidetes bacterium]|nr:signal transduction histidine kinase [Bacteroidota bacterium]
MYIKQHRNCKEVTSQGTVRWGLWLLVDSFFCLITLLLPSTSGAQQAVMFRHLTVNQGLSQGSVVSILQDSHGFMWFGTQDGLNRFDGYAFTVFKHSPTDSASLSGNFITTIAEDSSKTLWIGTLSTPEILNCFNPTTETFSRVPSNSIDLLHARVGSVFSTYEAPSGVRWSGSVGGGVTRLDRLSGKTTVFKHDSTDPASLANNKVYSVYGDRTGTIWVGTREGLDRFDAKTGGFVHYKHDDKNPNSLSNSWVWPILEDRRGMLWFGTYGGGLNRFDRVTERFTRFHHDEANSRSLCDDRLYSLYQDRSGMIWVGTINGIDCFNPEMGAFIHHFSDPKNPDGLIHNAVYSIHVDKLGMVWIATEGGLDRWDRSTGEFAHYRHDPSKAGSLGVNHVQCILEDKSGSLWLGTRSSGLDRFDRASGKFNHFRHDPSNPKSLSEDRVFALLEDRRGEIWIGTYGGGLSRYDQKTNTFRAYVHSDSIPGSLSGPGVWSLDEDHEGILWAGTSKGGLDRFDRATETFTHFRSDPSDSRTLSHETVLCLHEDRKGNLWVGTMNGLNRLDRETGTFERYFEKDGLPNSYINGILEDNQGNLWISTVKGISRYDPQQNVFQNFDQSDGLQGNEFNTGAFTKDHRTGEMYFGGMNGFNLFHPDKVTNNPFVPPVVFTTFIRYNTDDEEGKPIVEKGITAKSGIALTYKDNVASFEFAALNFYNTFKNLYAYKLEGFNDNWIQLGTERKATFTNLDAGEYKLLVRGSNNDGVWNNEGTSLKLVVTPPWWKTTWAYSGYTLMILSFLYGARRFEINRREQKVQVRESQLRAKAAEAEKRVLEVENDRKTKELEEARDLQLSMLPKDVPNLAHLEIAVFMKTATEVGGDYYDFRTESDGTLNVAFGDATGHGMQAGTIVTLMKGFFISDSSRLDIQTFFNHCSRSIKEIKLGRLLMAFSLLKVKGNKVAMSSAGMPPIYLYRKATKSVEEIMLRGMPLGAMKNFPYTLYEAELQVGDTVLLVSDGLPEQKNSVGEMFDYSRVQRTFGEVGDSTPDEIIKHLTDAGENWMNGAQQDDDITMLV